MMFKPTVFAAALLCSAAVSAASHWAIKDGIGSSTVRDSGTFKLNGTIVEPRRELAQAIISIDRKLKK